MMLQQVNDLVLPQANKIGLPSAIGTPTPQIRMLTMSQVTEKTGLSRSKIYLLMTEMGFPQSVQIGGGRAKRFIEAEINQWLWDQIQNNRTQLANPAKGGV